MSITPPTRDEYWAAVEATGRSWTDDPIGRNTQSNRDAAARLSALFDRNPERRVNHDVPTNTGGRAPHQRKKAA